jgi:hypothetical protein
MMPTIRIDEDVFEALKAIAEPFTDTPNSVIRRLLEGQGAIPSRKTEANRQFRAVIDFPPTPSARPANRKVLTPQPVYEAFLLYVLANDFKGSASKHDATTKTIEMMESRGFIGTLERERVATGETKAENTIAWGRNALKERGFISTLSPRGTWELTPEGVEEASRLKLPRG